MAMKYALRRGMHAQEQREDFGQFYCLALMQDETTDLKCQFSNFMRSIGGRSQNGEKHPKYYESLVYCPLSADYHYNELGQPPVDPIRNLQVSELRRALGGLKAQQALVASLYLRDFSLTEIARKCDVDTSRVSQIMAEIILQLRKRMC
jgi:DNA-directed RNA polymerase specialized sigma24 family protein